MQAFASITVQPNLITGWKLTISTSEYLFYCLIATVSIRAFLAIFRAFAIGSGEHLEDSVEGASNISQSGEVDISQCKFRYRWLISFAGFAGHKNIRDYWLSTVIGFSEAVCYPVIIFLNQPVIIGGWLAIKTAGQWRVWGKSRTAFNRFLVGNLLVLGLSYCWLLRYISN